MKVFVAIATAAAVLSGIALTAPAAEAAPFKRHYGKLTPHERTVIARSQRQLDALKWRVRADGRVNAWERAQVRMAEARHNALVRRLRHN